MNILVEIKRIQSPDWCRMTCTSADRNQKMLSKMSLQNVFNFFFARVGGVNHGYNSILNLIVDP